MLPAAPRLAVHSDSTHILCFIHLLAGLSTNKITLSYQAILPGSSPPSLDRADWPLGSGPRYMIRVTLFCTLCESENTRTCEKCTHFMRELHAIRVQFSHVRVFSGATKSDTSGHCLLATLAPCLPPLPPSQPTDWQSGVWWAPHCPSHCPPRDHPARSTTRPRAFGPSHAIRPPKATWNSGLNSTACVCQISQPNQARASSMRLYDESGAGAP